ncbi:MAG: polysaccharide deacetylase family protein [Patescibacteria group bacterium]
MRRIECAAIALLLLFAAAFGLHIVSKSRTFQFFGRITSHVTTDRKVVALTFDDGPTTYTNEVLKTLSEKNTVATFYVTGSGLEQYPEIGTSIVEQGHEMGNHSYSHSRFIFKSQNYIDSEINRTNALIRDAGFESEITFRPPYGKKLFGLPWYLMNHNIQTVTWNIEPDSYGSDSEFIVRYTVDNIENGSIILLHPFCESCNGKRAAIPEIIDALRARGYEFVTVSELLKFNQD